MTEKEKAKDKKIREAILNGLIDCRDAPDLGWSNFGGIHIDDCIDWLEKQGEQKPCMVQWKGDNLKEVIGFTGKDKNFEKWFKSFEEYEKYVHEHNDIFKLFNENGSHYEIPVRAWIVKTPDGYNIASNAVLKQKSADKIEPRFKVGDWVVQGCNILKIKCVGNEYYCFETVGGYVDDILVSEIDSLYHLWTIQDAKDGDMLACNEEILLFKSYSVLQGRISSYCWYNGHTNNFHSKEVIDTLLTKRNKICPATKEQCDALMKAINDAGYEWNAEKKELKKKRKS